MEDLITAQHYLAPQSLNLPTSFACPPIARQIYINIISYEHFTNKLNRCYTQMTVVMHKEMILQLLQKAAYLGMR